MTSSSNRAFGSMARGFTILELIMVVAIVAILAAVGLPSMRDFIRAAEVRDAATEFYAALALARSEAVKQHSVCPAPLGSKCVDVKRSTGSSWTGGWTVTVTDGTTNAQTTLQKMDPLSSNIAVAARQPDNIATTVSSDITYGSNGRVPIGELQTVIFYIAGAQAIQARCVSTGTSGSPYMRTDTNRNYDDGCF